MSSDVLDDAGAGGAAIRGGTVRIVGYGLTVGLSLISVPVLFRALGVVDAGRYVLALSIATITIGIADAGLSVIATRELATRDPADRDAFLRAVLGLRIALSALGVTAAVVYALAAGFDEVLVLGVLVAGTAQLVGSVQVAVGAVLSVQLRLGAVTAAELARQAVTTVGIIVLAIAGAGLLAFLGNVLVASIIGLVVALGLAGRTIPRRPSVDPRLWRELATTAVAYGLAAAVGVLYLRVGVLFVDALSSDRELGYFGISFRVIDVLIVLPQLMVLSGFPILARAARDDAERLAYGVGRMGVVCVLSGTLLALIIGIGAPVIIDLIGGADADPAADVLRLHSLALLGSFAAATASYALLAQGRTKAVLLQTATALVIAVVASALLTPDGGAEGAALGAVLAEAGLCLAGWGLLATGPHALRPRVPELPRIALAAGVGVLPALVLPPAFAATAGAVLFLAVALALRAVPAELLDEAKGALRRRA